MTVIRTGVSMEDSWKVSVYLFVVGFLIGCGAAPEQSGIRSLKNEAPVLRSQKILGPPLTVIENQDPPPKITEARPVLTDSTIEYVGPKPNAAFLEFFEALNVRYGAKGSTSSSQTARSRKED